MIAVLKLRQHPVSGWLSCLTYAHIQEDTTADAVKPVPTERFATMNLDTCEPGIFKITRNDFSKRTSQNDRIFHQEIFEETS